jgi:hypothetical protein
MNQDKRWRHHVKRFMQRFGFETTAQAEEIMTAGPILWNGLKHLDVRGRRYVADYLRERRKEKDAQLGAAFKKHYAEQGTRAGARWDDNAGTHDVAGYGIDRSQDYEAFARPSTFQENLTKLLDDQDDLPAGKLLGGGGLVSANKVGGVGPGPAKRTNTGGAELQNNRDARRGHNGRR